ncbi:MAG: glycoside hydrolase family 127 protein [Chloroflexi bacterium]|nr:glycoside hydrolase family 127 protein [Chloroflexota bacterium]
MRASPRRAAGPLDASNSAGARWRTLSADSVRLDGGLLARRQAVNRDAALPHGWRMLDEAGNFENFRVAAGRSRGSYRGPVYMDSDVYKWIEAASFQLPECPSSGLAAAVDEAIDDIEAAQQADGYLNSYYTAAQPGRRWTDLALGHELYCAGHLFQAAVAHHRGTGSSRLLSIACRFADHIDATFGPARRPATPGHPEVEMALVELYRETGERRYLNVAGFFIDQRGHGRLGPNPLFNSSAYFQDRVPVREASEFEGHAVRALYLATGVADMYLESGEQALLDALKRQWQDLISHKLYVTGGIGSRHHAGAFGQPYELPNELASCETCAAVASLMWCWRMLLITGQACFADLWERTFYNAVLAGVSLDGTRYFYLNPLADNGAEEHLHRGGPRRKPWHAVACCPPNVMRIVASLAHYVATADADGLQIHQFGPARVAADAGRGGPVVLRMAGDYPWDGRVRVTVEQAGGAVWVLSLRRPAWAEQVAVRVNGVPIDAAPAPNGYQQIERAWRPGDAVELELAMAPRLVEGHPWIESTRGCIAIERGPLVYCLEQADHAAPIYDLELDPGAPLTTHWRPDLLEGVAVVCAAGYQIDRSRWAGRLYRPFETGSALSRRRTELTAIPYYAWANRGSNAMRVWLPHA